MVIVLLMGMDWKKQLNISKLKQMRLIVAYGMEMTRVSCKEYGDFLEVQRRETREVDVLGKAFCCSWSSSVYIICSPFRQRVNLHPGVGDFLVHRELGCKVVLLHAYFRVL